MQGGKLTPNEQRGPSKYARKKQDRERGIRPDFDFKNEPLESRITHEGLGFKGTKRERWPQTLQARVRHVLPGRKYLFLELNDGRPVYLETAILLRDTGIREAQPGMLFVCIVFYRADRRQLFARKVASYIGGS